MRVSVIGGGAIGLLISYFLKLNQHEPVLYTRTLEQAKAINQSGLTYIDNFGNTETIHIEVKQVEEYAGFEDYCVVTVTQNAIKDLRFLHQRTFNNISLLFLQNGMGHIDWIKNLPQENISVGVVEHGAMKEGYTSVHHVGMGKVKVSAFRGNFALDWQSIFSKVELFPVTLESNWEKMLLIKLIINASINPVTAMLRIPNGQLLDNGYAYKMMKHLFEETIHVLNMNGMKDDLWKELLTICRNTSLNRSSMLKSIESGKQTEIDSITGEIIKQANSMNKPVPFSRFAYYAVKGLEWRG